MNVAVDPEARPALVPAGNKARPVAPAARKLLSKRVEAKVEEKKRDSAVSARSVLRRHDLLLSSNLSLNASCASDASTDSFCSRASTGRIGRSGFTGRRRQSVPRSEKVAAKMDRIGHGGFLIPPSVQPEGKSRCPWVTPNSDPCYAVFHDEEWGVAVHDDKKLFELLVLSSALGELTWPAILSKRHIFREVFMNFDPVSVSKLNEKKIIAPGSSASSLLSESKLRAIIENSRQLLKIVEECGSFDSYCWSFVNHKPIISRFRYSRQVPVKTSKADMISKDLMRRGFRGVGPTVIYSFMQAAGMTNDHLISCYRLEECSAAAAASTSAAQGADEGINGDRVHKQNKMENRCEGELGIIDLELSRAVDGLSIMVLSSS